MCCWHVPNGTQNRVWNRFWWEKNRFTMIIINEGDEGGNFDGRTKIFEFNAYKLAICRKFESFKVIEIKLRTMATCKLLTKSLSLKINTKIVCILIEWILNIYSATRWKWRMKSDFHASINFSIYDVNSVKCFHFASDFIYLFFPLTLFSRSIFVEFSFPVCIFINFFFRTFSSTVFVHHFSHFRISFVASIWELLLKYFHII